MNAQLKNKSLDLSNLNSKILVILSLAFFSSCSPTIHFLGDTYPATTDIDVFYDAKDVEKQYKTIGKMTHDKFLDYEVEAIKESMIKKAKEKGGDGIIFTQNTSTRVDDEMGDRLSITADVIKYD
ncbi:MAG: hypothetical protein HKN16_02470 [Saprospiraceae bacterium]|nr:hypothetical protein [Saprospiraceae bacterium]